MGGSLGPVEVRTEGSRDVVGIAMAEGAADGPHPDGRIALIHFLAVWVSEVLAHWIAIVAK